MKVLLINTVSGIGSTGRTCIEKALVLEEQGHECYIAYGQGHSSYYRSFKVGTTLENHLHNLGSRVLGKQGYFTKRGTERLVKFIEEIQPDVINLHNLHGNYINLEILFDFLITYNKAVVLTLHDCWAFTGKCTHYTDVQCFKWQTQCEHCPQVHKYPASLFLDSSFMMYKDKKRWFNAIKNLSIITVSDWLLQQVEQSFLKDHTTLRIYNWVNHDIFKPIERRTIYQQYGIEPNKFLILGVSAGWSKNQNRLIDFIKLSKMVSEDMQIVLIGKTYNLNDIPHNVISIPYLNSESALTELYASADVYVHLSTEDTFGKVIAESMSCGTPVIVYNSTACPEIVGEGCGYVVDKRNVEAVYDKIKLIKSQPKSIYSYNCRAHVKANYDRHTNIQQTIDLYQLVISKNDC
ncbi:glycosyltransferase [Pedobacter sp. Hv1]|uniref:glycosyltransferase n=1 Tax=Pedobacter sp. Hv1 TaxID=1740090 RepID=UPI0006D8D097|nr:glycosyltransferase [Pedobacter sp. Hv1]KQB99624.1 hypothetical protein AQF98_18920 [Pedobacter sp. Hv1]